MREPRFNLTGVTNGVLADVLRLEVETDPTGLVNLIVNPDGTLGGYGWEATSVGTLVRSATTNGPALEFVAATGAPFFLTEYMAVTAGRYLAARWLEAGYTGPGTGGWYRARFDYYNAAGAYVSSSAYTSWYQLTTNVRAYGPVLIPATVTKVRLHIDLGASVSGAALSGGTGYYRFTDVTVASSPVSGDLGITRTNLLTNPSMTTNATGWEGDTNEGSTVARVAAPATIAGAEATAMGFGLQCTSGFGDGVGIIAKESSTRAVVALDRYYLRARYAVRVKDTPGAGYLPDGDTVWLSARWYNGATHVSTTGVAVKTLNIAEKDVNGWVYFDLDGYVNVPASGVTGMRALFSGGGYGEGSFIVDRVLAEKVAAGTTGTRTYFDGATTDAGGWVYDWTGTANASTSTAASPELDYIPPVPTIDVLNAAYSLSIGVNRNALDVGTITAEVTDVALDPADSDLIRPGRAARLAALDANGEWRRLYTGTLNGATVTYPLLAKVPEAKKARIVLSGTDNISTLAQTPRLSSVATIAELPFVLEGAGVPWNVNGSGAQVGAATVRTYDTNATALDQVAMTRDTVRGFAWVDPENVLQAWDAATIDDAPVLTLDEDVYTANGVAISFDTDACINEVTVVRRSVDALGAAIEEISTYTDAASIAQWGRHSATFTVLAPVVPATFAAAVLASNATPVRRITSVTVNIKDETYLPVAHLDLYDVVTLVNTEKGINEDAFITGIQHAITADKWLITFTFSAVSSVAAPQVIPPLKPGAVGVPFAIGYRTTTAGSFASGSYLAFGTADNQTIRGGITYNLTTGVYTVPVAGVYQINAQVAWASNATSWRGIAITAGGQAHYGIVPAVSGVATIAAVSVCVYMTAGATVTPVIRQNSGAALALDLTAGYNFVSIARISD